MQYFASLYFAYTLKCCEGKMVSMHVQLNDIIMESNVLCEQLTKMQKKGWDFGTKGFL
jgi:hypothetical protein